MPNCTCGTCEKCQTENALALVAPAGMMYAGSKLVKKLKKKLPALNEQVINPFVSEAQRRFMYAKHPEIAKRWTKEAKSKGEKPVQNGPAVPYTPASPQALANPTIKSANRLRKSYKKKPVVAPVANKGWKHIAAGAVAGGAVGAARGGLVGGISTGGVGAIPGALGGAAIGALGGGTAAAIAPGIEKHFSKKAKRKKLRLGSVVPKKNPPAGKTYIKNGWKGAAGSGIAGALYGGIKYGTAGAIGGGVAGALVGHAGESVSKGAEHVVKSAGRLYKARKGIKRAKSKVTSFVSGVQNDIGSVLSGGPVGATQRLLLGKSLIGKKGSNLKKRVKSVVSAVVGNEDEMDPMQEESVMNGIRELAKGIIKTPKDLHIPGRGPSGREVGTKIGGKTGGDYGAMADAAATYADTKIRHKATQVTDSNSLVGKVLRTPSTRMYINPNIGKKLDAQDKEKYETPISGMRIDPVSPRPKNLTKPTKYNAPIANLEEHLDLCANEWTDAARAASIEARRRKAQGKERNLFHQPDYHQQKIDEYNRQRMHAMGRNNPDEEEYAKVMAAHHTKLQLDPEYHAREEFYHRQREMEHADLASEGSGSVGSKLFHGTTRGIAGSTLGSAVGGLGGYAAGRVAGSLVGSLATRTIPAVAGAAVGGALGAFAGPLAPIAIPVGALAGGFAGRVAGGVAGKFTGKVASGGIRSLGRTISAGGRPLRKFGGHAFKYPIQAVGHGVSSVGQSIARSAPRKVAGIGGRAGGKVGSWGGALTGSTVGSVVGGAMGVQSGIHYGEHKAEQDHLKQAARARASADYHNLFADQPQTM